MSSPSGTETTNTTETTEAPARDEVREALVDRLRADLGDDLLDSHVEKGDLWIRVPAAAWHRAAEVCRGSLACDYFCFLSGIDWMPSSVPNPEEAAADEEATAPVEPAQQAAASAAITTGYAGGDTRFQVLARLYSTTAHHGITLKADLDDEAPSVPSIVDLYAGAEWHEREAWEMYGFDFPGHPALRHLFLPGEFEGNPLRKDFPLLAREVKPWPGIVDVEPMPGDDDAEAAEVEGGET